MTDTVQTDPTWTSGYYMVEAVLTSGPDAGRVATTFFILHEAPTQGRPGSRILVQVPVNTWEAYNSWGGRSLYDLTGPRMYRVSFQRPFGEFAQSPFWWEIQLVRFLEREGYDVSYQTDLDTDANPASLLQHRLVVVAGHDEYWTSAIRSAFDAALAGGTNLAFIGANVGYWRVRYEDSGQTIFSYKSLYDPTPESRGQDRDVPRDRSSRVHARGQCVPVTRADRPAPRLHGHSRRPGRPVAPRHRPAGGRPDPGNGLARARQVGMDGGPYPLSCFHPGLVDLFHYDRKGVDSDADASRFTAPSGARVFAAGSFQLNWALDDWRSDGTLGPKREGVGNCDRRLVPVVAAWCRGCRFRCG